MVQILLHHHLSLYVSLLLETVYTYFDKIRHINTGNDTMNLNFYQSNALTASKWMIDPRANNGMSIYLYKGELNSHQEKIQAKLNLFTRINEKPESVESVSMSVYMIIYVVIPLSRTCSQKHMCQVVFVNIFYFGYYQKHLLALL